MKCPHGFCDLQVVTELVLNNFRDVLVTQMQITNVKERTKTTFIPQFSYSLCTLIKKDNTNIKSKTINIYLHFHKTIFFIIYLSFLFRCFDDDKQGKKMPSLLKRKKDNILSFFWLF